MPDKEEPKEEPIQEEVKEEKKVNFDKEKSRSPKRNVTFKIIPRGRGKRDKSGSSHSSKRKNSDNFTWMPRKDSQKSDPLGDYKPPFKIRERSRGDKKKEESKLPEKHYTVDFVYSLKSLNK